MLEENIFGVSTKIATSDICYEASAVAMALRGYIRSLTSILAKCACIQFYGDASNQCASLL